MESSSTPGSPPVLPNRASYMNPERKDRPNGPPPPSPAAPAPSTSPPQPSGSIRPPPGPPPLWLAKPSEPPLKRLNEQKKGTPSVGFTNPNPSDGAFLSELQARCKQRRQHSTTDEEEEKDDVEAGPPKQEEVSKSGHLDTEVSPQSPTVVVVPGTIPMPPPPPPPLDLLKTQKIPALKSHRLSTPVTLSLSKASSSQAGVMAELMQNLAKRKSMTQESSSCSSTSTSAPNGSSTPQKSDFTGVAKLQLPWAPSRLTKPKMILPDSSEEKEIEKHPEQSVNAPDSKCHTVPANRNRRLTMPPLASHSTFTEKLDKEANEEEGSSVPTQRSFKDTLAMWNNKAEKAKSSVQSRFSLVLNQKETSRRQDSTTTTTTGEDNKEGSSVTNGSESRK